MPDKIESNIEKIKILSSVLEEARRNLDQSSLAAENLSSIINNLNSAVSGTGQFSFNIEQIEKALNSVISGIGSQVRLGNVGRLRTGAVSQALHYDPTTDPAELAYRRAQQENLSRVRPRQYVPPEGEFAYPEVKGKKGIPDTVMEDTYKETDTILGSVNQKVDEYTKNVEEANKATTKILSAEKEHINLIKAAQEEERKYLELKQQTYDSTLETAKSKANEGIDKILAAEEERVKLAELIKQEEIEYQQEKQKTIDYIREEVGLKKQAVETDVREPIVVPEGGKVPAGTGVEYGKEQIDEWKKYVEKQFRSAGAKDIGIEQLNKDLYDLGERFSINAEKMVTFKTKTVDVADGVRRISGNIKATTGDVEEFTRYIDDAGNVLSEMPQKITYTADKLDSIFGEDLSERVRTTAEELGFDPEDIQEPIKQYADGMRRIRFEKENLAGVTEELTLVTDKYGNVLVDTQKRFRTFFSSIRRNIGEMIKWSAAVVVVWGSLRKLNDLIELSIKNESELANVAIVLGRTTEDLREIFDSAAAAAAATGESIDGVIEGYTLAYRATAQISDETERAAVTQRLLTDALVLSKLSSLEQAKALDVLVAGLTQMGYGLDEGEALLNKWMATTKAANVDMQTLAESYSIMGASALNAGINMDEINGIVATLAKAFPYSATEIANSARAIISAFQTETAEEELIKFGIAIKDSGGEMRDFMEILDEIATRYQQGIISKADLQGLSRTLVGGVRRGAQFEALITDYESIGAVAEASAEAQADAYDALEVKLETVQTAITELSNAFQSLAFTLGEEGGVLDILHSVIGALDEVLNGVEGVIKVLGTAGPLMLATLGAGGIAGAGGRRSIAGMLGMSLGGLPGLSAGAQTGIQRGIINNPDATFATLGVGLQIASNIFEGLENENWGEVGGQIAGNLGGALVGFLAAGPIGAIVGSAIGEGFVSNILQYEGKFEGFFANVLGDAQEDALDESTVESKRAKLEQRALETAWSLMGQGNQAAGAASSALGSWFLSGPLGDIARIVRTGVPDLTPEQVAVTKAGTVLERPERYTDEEVKNAQELLDTLEKITELEEASKDVEANKETSAVVKEQLDLMTQYESVLTSISETQRESLKEDFLAGEINIRSYKTALDQLSTSQSINTQFFSAFGDRFMEMNSDIETAEDAFEIFTNVMTRGSREVYNELVILVNEIAVLKNLMETETDPAILSNLSEQVSSLQTEASELTSSLQYEINRSMLQLPTVFTMDELRPEDIQLVMREATRLSEEEIAAGIENGLIKGFSTVAEVLATLDPFLLQAGENGGYTYAQGFFSKFLDPAFQKLMEEGLVKAAETSSRSLKTFDFPSGQWGAIEARMDALAANLTSQGFGDVLNYQDYVALFSDNVAMPIHADLTLLNIAMQELIDINEKQLQGVYNLPTDASFYVPFQGYELGFGEGGAGGGVGGGVGGGEGTGTPFDEATRWLEGLGLLRDSAQSLEEASKAIIESRAGYKEDADIREQERARMDQWFEQNRVDRDYYQDRPYDYQESTPFHSYPYPGAGPPGFGGAGPTDFWDIQPIFPQPDDISSVFESLKGSLEGVSTNLNLNVESTTTLVVDGRELANVIKPYMYNDLLRAESESGSISATIVI